MGLRPCSGDICHLAGRRETLKCLIVRPLVESRALDWEPYIQARRKGQDLGVRGQVLIQEAILRVESKMEPNWVQEPGNNSRAIQTQGHKEAKNQSIRTGRLATEELLISLQTQSLRW